MNDRHTVTARALSVEELAAAEVGISEQLARIRAAVAFAEDVPMRDALDSSGWQRRGFLQRLSRRPRLHEVK